MNGQDALPGLEPTPMPAHALPSPDENEIGAMHRHAIDTEARAAVEITPRTGTWRRRVLDCIAASGDEGRTTWEVHRALGGILYTVAPRVNELLRAGWIVDSGRRRATNSGKAAAVWVLSGQARVQLDEEGK